MTTETPHYLLFSEASRQECATARWRFVLQQVSTNQRFSASDVEACPESTERLELLAVVRGLEALDGAARVTLVTKSRYVSRGIKLGIAEWRENDWCWERFGRIVPVRDKDLWQRVARALEIHQVDCQAWQFDAVAEEATADSSCAEAKPCARRELRRPARTRRRVARGHVAPQRTGSSWAERWAGAIDSLTRSGGLSLRQGAAS